MKNRHKILSMSMLVISLSGCVLFETTVSFKIGVVSSDVAYALSPDYIYRTISATLDGTSIPSGSYETVECVMGFSETSKTLEINYTKNSSNGISATLSMNTYLYPDDGEYVAVLGRHSRQFESLSEMNSYLSDGGFPTFGGSGSTDSVCGSSYTGPTSDPQRDSYCQAAYAYRCLYGYSLNSEQVQAQCDLYAAMGGRSCSYCK